MTIHDVYSTDGLLKKKFSDYEVREGQVKMSELVMQVLTAKQNAVIEGATGVGKSFGYLIPSIISNVPVIVSTSNKSLQDQLNEKDLPTLQDILGQTLSWTVLKGKSNYFCHERFQANEKDILVALIPDKGTESDYDEAKLKMQQIRDWVDEDGIGDMEKCPLDIVPRAREYMCCSNETKHEKDSDASLHCYANRARERAKNSQIVLVNHTLLALDLNLQRMTEGKVSILPRTDAIIIDEAHEFEKAAVLAFSDEISIFSLLHIMNRQIVKKQVPKATRDRIEYLLKRVLGNYLPEKGLSGYYKEQQTPFFEGLGEVIEALNSIIHALTKLEGSASEQVRRELSQIEKEVEHFQERLEVFAKEDKNTLKWSEARDSNYGDPIVRLKCVPINISPLIQKGLFVPGRSVICCSATLSVYGTFAYFKEQIGMPVNPQELIVPSHFDYKQQALVYVSNGDHDKFYEMSELLRMSQGRAFLLFCSYKDMREAFQYVKTEHPKLIQSNDKPRSQLLQEFLDTPNAVLFGTKSFWEGVDVKGDKLSLVVIHKIPFENPSNLVFKAKSDRYDAEHGRGQAFVKLSIPDACLKLKQGSGRLIRSATDKGVVALLDERVNFKPYGKMVIESLPPAYRTQTLEKVERFFEKIKSD